MTANEGKTRLYNNGIIANNIHLILKRWIIEEESISMILSDSTTVFASVRDVLDTKDTMQCRKLLGLANNVDLALIFTVTNRTARVADKNIITTWIGSDLQGANIKILIRSDLGAQLQNVVVGTVCAILNPDIKQQTIQADIKAININRLDDVLVIGELDGLEQCKAVTVKGESCKNVVYIHNQGEYCKYHLKFNKPKPKPKPKLNNQTQLNNQNQLNPKQNNSNKLNNLNKRPKTQPSTKSQVTSNSHTNAINSHKTNSNTTPNTSNTSVNTSNTTVNSANNSLNTANNTLNTVNSVNNVNNVSGWENVFQGLRSVMCESKPYVFSEPSRPVKPTETMARLGDLNQLMQKIINNRSPNTANSINTVNGINTLNSINTVNIPENSVDIPKSTQPAKLTADTERYNEFLKLANLINNHITKEKKEYNKLLGAIQMLTNRVRVSRDSGVTCEMISSSNIMKTCEMLLDHPLENIAMSALKLRRAIRKLPKPKHNQFNISRTNTQDNITDKYKQEVMMELDGLMGLTSSMDSVPEKEQLEHLLDLAE